MVAGCAVNLDARRFDEIDDRVTPLVGTADEVAHRIATQPLDELGSACADTEHDVLWRHAAADVSSAARPGPGAS